MPVDIVAPRQPRTQLEPEVFLKRYRTIAERKADSEEAKSAWKSEVENAKSGGMNLTSLKWAEKLQKMNLIEAQQTIRDLVFYATCLGVRLFAQGELDLGPVQGPSAKEEHDQRVWEAGMKGYLAGKKGSPIDSNPHAPGSEEHQKWAQSWHDGVMDRPPQTGITDIQPKSHGDKNPEDSDDDDEEDLGA